MVYKKMKELKECLCEQIEETTVYLASGSYTSLQAIKDESGLTLTAWGDGTAFYMPKYCPFCGKHLRESPKHGGD